MKIRLIRHATLLIILKNYTILLDPMLSPAGVLPPVQNSADSRRNPLVPLPVTEDALMAVDAVILTHTHWDHFDDAAARLLPKCVPVFCQPEDEEKLKGLGFTLVQPIEDKLTWNGISLTRTQGQHGTGKIGRAMAPVSGFVLQTEGEPVLYIAGDTIWCPEVECALNDFNPGVSVVYAGEARFAKGDPITMTANDIAQVCRQSSGTRVVAVHMESINHCRLTRRELRDFIKREGLSNQVLIPADGEWLEL